MPGINTTGVNADKAASCAEDMWKELELAELLVATSDTLPSYIANVVWLWIGKRVIWSCERKRVHARMKRIKWDANH